MFWNSLYGIAFGLLFGDKMGNIRKFEVLFLDQ